MIPERLDVLTDEFQQKWIEENLAKCTPEQQELFYKMYPMGPRKDQLLNAADQIRRTIIKNERITNDGKETAQTERKERA